MPESFNIAVLIGSLRRGAYSRMVANALIELAPASLHCSIIEIGDLALYNQDLEESPPPAWLRFRDEIRPAHGVLLVSPEYNRGVPAVLKNALDVGSRPYGASVWERKPVAVLTNSPGGIGGFGANHQIRQSLVFLNMPTMQQPEAYVGGVAKMFDDQGKLIAEGARGFFSTFMVAFADWVALHARA